MAKNEKLLEEIRDNFRAAKKEWQEIQEQGRIDMRYLSGDPWEEDDKRQRKDAGRPCMAFDELGQYCNQAINEVRQNKRGITVNPAGNGATDKTAEFRQALIRGIEYESKAETAYITAYENALQRGYGYVRVGRDYISDSAFEQRITIKRVVNPDTVLFDADCTEFDGSDADYCFVIKRLRKERFASQYPRAQKTSFDAEDIKAAPEWIRDDHIQLAEYWKITRTPGRLYLVDSPTGPLTLTDAQMPDSRDGIKILRERKTEQRTVRQYVTNGVEILEDKEEPGKYIPIIPCFGKEIYVDDGSGAQRVLLSLVRLARDPYMYYCFLCSQEAEEASLTPKVPYVAYTGQIENKQAWADSLKVPKALLEANARVTDMAGDTILPLPQRQQFVPNFQAYEIAKEAAKRAIQSAVGMGYSSVGRADKGDQSGTALKALDQQADLGSFHFTDNFNRFIEHVGRVVEDKLNAVYDTEREVGIREDDDTHRVVKINTAAPYEDPESKEQYQHVLADQGEHAVTISTGASFQSQREEAADFANTIVQNIEQLPLPPDVKSKFLALIVKLKNLGPIGDSMVELLDPEQGSPQEQLAQMQARAAQTQQLMAAMQAELQKLQLERAGKVIDNEYKAHAQKLDNDIEILKALITAKSQRDDQEFEMYRTFWTENHGAAHEIAMQKDQQGADAQLADQQAQQQQAAAAQQQAAEQQQPAS